MTLIQSVGLLLTALRSPNSLFTYTLQTFVLHYQWEISVKKMNFPISERLERD